MARILVEPFDKALIVENPHHSLDTWLDRLGIGATRVDVVPDQATLIDALRGTGAQILCKRSRVEVTREVLAACPSLQVVQLCCIGDDSVDKEACADLGVMVFNDPVSNGRSVVEMAIGHIITLARRLYETDVSTRDHQWDKSNRGRYEVLGKTLGVVGLGNIGRQVARIAEALGMEVQFFDTRLVAQEVGAEMGWRSSESLESLFRTSDVVTVHTSARDAWGRDNAGLLDPYLSQLGADRGDASPRLFLNLARGNLHSAEALLGAVHSGAVRRAAVDVYPEEPGPGVPDWVNPYAGDARIACSPHIGAATQEAQPRIARRVAQTLGDYVKLGAVRDCVFSPRLRLAVRGTAGNAVLAVIHSTSRGTKKAVDDAIYEAGASNLQSTHRDFGIGIAYDLSLLDRPLAPSQLSRIVVRAAELADDLDAIRTVRQILL